MSLKTLYSIHDRLCTELDHTAEEMSKPTARGMYQQLDMLLHALKSCTILISMEEADQDGGYRRSIPYEPDDYGRSYNRGRYMTGRDSRGRYRADEPDRQGQQDQPGNAGSMRMVLKRLMESQDDPETKRVLRNLMDNY